jgi:ADP-ribosylglycohydrolase
MWSFFRAETFEEAACIAVNLGDDADTTGAVVGQIAGAYYGEEGIRQRWRTIVARRDLIEKLADKLYEFGGKC